MTRGLSHLLAAGIVALVVGALGATVGAERETTLEDLGAALFSDADLSLNRTTACASCHAAEHAFVDVRPTAAGHAASLGDDGRSIGVRNAPTVGYAALTPAFRRRHDGHYEGGHFLDGRAATLAEQAGGPPLNPIEMGMPDKAAVVARLREKPAYVEAFTRHFGDDVFGDDEKAFAAMTEALAAFERTAAFAPFDSKYDRFLRGEYEMTPQEELGRVLFFSPQFSNCKLCHQINAAAVGERETFTNYRFHNIGVPANAALDAANGRTGADHGLAENPAVPDGPAEAGKFKVPTLRNVAVTGPYMHNGVFADLRTVVLFYNKYNSIAARRQIDPETGAPWAPPEVAANIALPELTTGPALDDRRIDALVAFLETLTDRRYEPLLDERR